MELSANVENMDQDFVQIARQAAHDIRSPLTALKMLAGGLSDLPDDQARLLNRIISRISAIAEDLLDQTRKPTNECNQQADNTSESLETALQEITAEKQIEYGPSVAVCLKNRTIKQSDLKVDVNTVALKRALSNLVNNSVEAGSRRVEIAYHDLGSEVLIEVKDDGRGFQAPSIGKRGHGLGLSFTTAIVQSYGGSVTITNPVDRGATVRINLPKSTPRTNELRRRLGGQEASAFMAAN